MIEKYSKFGKFLIKVNNSCYTSRSGKKDIIISRPASWGARESDGKLYITSMTIAAENNEPIRIYELVPDVVIAEAIALLKQEDDA